MERQVPRVGQIRKAGQVRVTPLKEEGKTRGMQVEYGDGRIESVVRPDVVRGRISMRES